MTDARADAAQLDPSSATLAADPERERAFKQLERRNRTAELARKYEQPWHDISEIPHVRF